MKRLKLLHSASRLAAIGGLAFALSSVRAGSVHTPYADVWASLRLAPRKRSTLRSTPRASWPANLKRTRSFGSAFGVTPMIGMNDVQDETFTLANAQSALNSTRNNGYGLVSAWSVGRELT